MKSEKRLEYLTRDGILKLLSDEEVASVSTAEATSHLSNGDEYVDLDQLEQGVRRAQGITPPMGHGLPNKGRAREHLEEDHEPADTLLGWTSHRRTGAPCRPLFKLRFMVLSRRTLSRT
jgi:hypothetical protein